MTKNVSRENTGFQPPRPVWDEVDLDETFAESVAAAASSANSDRPVDMHKANKEFLEGLLVTDYTEGSPPVSDLGRTGLGGLR